ncbi:MAG: ABC transporter ATP-binding protein [Dehalococcoidia bacterium]|nr:ABC transporter ATP-binding protein [Dehalococcoidia bacterium]
MTGVSTSSALGAGAHAAIPAHAVAVQGLTHLYQDRKALDDFTLDVPEGSVFGLLGPNGSGKSSFITLLAAMSAPASGTVRVFGQPAAVALRALTGVVFQENTADPLMSVGETLHLAGRLFGLGGDSLRDRSRDVLIAFGLADRVHDPVATLSGGMRRRLEVARAILHNPRLLLLDEPTTGVDPDERRALWEALLGRQRHGRTVLLATNDLAEADAVCDHVAFLQAGRVVATGTPRDLKSALRRESVRVQWASPSPAQLAAIRAWPGTGELSLDGGDLHVTVDDAAAFVPRLFSLAPGTIRSVSIRQSSLEDAYFQHVSRRAPTAPVA